MKHKKNKGPYEVFLHKTCNSDKDVIMNLFRDGTVFKLTGADEINFDFHEEGEFNLIFRSRGKIFGSFVKISDNELILDWNVEGFNRPPESNTALKISLLQNDDMCTLTLEHRNISNEEAASAKKLAWTEILDEMESTAG
ncbi:MAG: SRPBCC domain-containing protein [Bacteroidetes bacterium]|nr:SRPBCC domain-containing protein [Bacteroidota bacterium]